MKLTTAYENKQNQGIDDCNTFFFFIENIFFRSYECQWSIDPTTRLPTSEHYKTLLQLLTARPIRPLTPFINPRCTRREISTRYLRFRPPNTSVNHTLTKGSLRSVLCSVKFSSINHTVSFPTMRLFAESVEQDQPAHTCSLILLCTLRSFSRASVA